jgi:transposase InsO family protein
MDLYSHRIVGWSMASRLTSTLVKDALKLAIALRQPGSGLVHHSDCRSRYACADYRLLVTARGMVAGISREWDCYDYALIESFFGALRSERAHHRQYRTRAEARQDIFRYIEVLYSRKRRHSSLGCMSPAQFERSLNLCADEMPTKWGEHRKKSTHPDSGTVGQ